MKTASLSLRSLALAIMLVGATGAHAGIAVYTSQTEFNAAVTAPGVDTYDDLSVELYNSPLSRTAGGYSYTASAATGLFGAGVPGDHWLSTNRATDSIVFSGFSGGVTAFGGNFFGTDISGMFLANINMMLTATDGTTTISQMLNGTTTGSFLGFLSDSPLQNVSLTVASTGGIYWPTANNLTLAMAGPVSVPEPGTYSLLLLAMALLGFATRRSQSVR